jgi:sugar lactone lactonase YvrE
MSASRNPEAFPGHDGGAWQPVPASTVASWPAGHFAENLAVSAAGDVFVSLHSHHRIERYSPATGRVATFAEMPAPVAGLAFDAEGRLWATGGAVGQPPGYVWRVAPDGSFALWVEIPDARFMNGCTPCGRSLLVCESITGRILCVDMQRPAWRTWLADERLRPTTPTMPGANGIKLRRGHAYISMTDSNLIFRAPVDANDNPGPLSVFADTMRADDFAFAESGALYIATHPAQTVMRLDVDGARTTIAGPAEGVVGSTACAFGRTAQDANALYVTTGGGLYFPYQGKLEDAKLVRLVPGETGAPILAPP